jgi:hypothetical protein
VLCNKLGLKSEIIFTVYDNYSAAHASIVIENDLSYLGLNKLTGIVLPTKTT